MGITITVEINNINRTDYASCADSWHSLVTATVGAELMAATLCTILIWTLIRYRRKGRV